MQSAGSRTFQKYFTTNKQDINFTSLKLIGYSAHLLKKAKAWDEKQYIYFLTKMLVQCS